MRVELGRPMVRSSSSPFLRGSSCVLNSCSPLGPVAVLLLWFQFVLVVVLGTRVLAEASLPLDLITSLILKVRSRFLSSFHLLRFFSFYFFSSLSLACNCCDIEFFRSSFSLGGASGSVSVTGTSVMCWLTILYWPQILRYCSRMALMRESLATN